MLGELAVMLRASSRLSRLVAERCDPPGIDREADVRDPASRPQLQLSREFRVHASGQ